jgi:RNA polymerase sigma factor (sigma-70 family)
LCVPAKDAAGPGIFFVGISPPVALYGKEMTDPQTLLVEYAANGSEAAFRELAARYTDLVYSSAVRLVDGDTHQAEDVTQMVFADLARLARTFSAEVLLGGWLHRRTCHVAANLRRSERRRQHRERQAAQMMNAQEDHAEARMEHLAPILDDAINQLNAADRAAIVLRFFEGRDLRSVGQALATNDDAAQKRVSRALEKLRGLLVRRGVVLSASGLAAVLSAHAVTAAPAALAATVSASALASAAAGGSLTVTLLELMAITKLKVALGAVVVAGIGTTLVLEHQAQAKLREDNRALQQQVEQWTRLNEANQGLSNLLAQASTNGSLLDQLDRLRSEAAQLRQQQRGLDPARAENRQLRSARAGASARPLTPAERWPNPLLVLPKESWTFAGYAEPEAAIQTMLWAENSGDAKAMLDSFIPEARQEAKTKKDEERMVAIIKGNVSRWTGLRILEKQTLAEDMVAFTVHAQGVDSVFKMKFKRIGAEWKYSGEDSAD